MEIRYKRCDAGRKSDGFGTEIRDCAVRAIALLLQTNYATAHEDLRALGRKAQRKFKWDLAVKHYDLEKMTFSPGPTVAAVLEDIPCGCFAITVRGHVFAVIDGVIHDTAKKGWHSRKRVQGLYWVKAS